jgi:hypothetical protein
MREVSCEFPLVLKGGFDFYMKEGAGKANRITEKETSNTLEGW